MRVTARISHQVFVHLWVHTSIVSWVHPSLTYTYIYTPKSHIYIHIHAYISHIHTWVKAQIYRKCKKTSHCTYILTSYVKIRALVSARDHFKVQVVIERWVCNAPWFFLNLRALSERWDPPLRFSSLGTFAITSQRVTFKLFSPLSLLPCPPERVDVTHWSRHDSLRVMSLHLNESRLFLFVRVTSISIC